MRARLLICVLGCALLTAMSLSCGDKSTSGGGEGQEVRFMIHSSPGIVSSPESPQQITLRTMFDCHCIDRTNPECETVMFVSPHDNDENHESSHDWLGYPADHSNCFMFIAVVNQDGIGYTFNGQIQRQFGDPEATGLPFVIGMYDAFDGEDYTTGSFEFFEQSLQEDNNSTCG